MVFNLRLGERVHYLLRKYNKSQKELADFLNTKTSTINGWKQANRNPSSDMIVPICDFFGISTDYFLNYGEFDVDENNLTSTAKKKDMFDNNIFAVRLHLLRTQANISQKSLGDSVGVSYHAISKIENKQRAASIEIIYALAEYFNVSIDYLTGRTDKPDMFNNKQKLTEEELVLLDDFRLLNKYEQNIIRGKISEFIYNKNIENDNLEVSQELINADVINRLE